MTEAPSSSPSTDDSQRAVHVDGQRRYAEALDALRTTCRSAPSLQPGDRFGEFVVRRRLGSGGMGVVYEAAQTSLGGRLVALKVVVWEGDPARREFVLAEAHGLAALRHPHLGEVYGIAQESGAIGLAMALIDGVSLAEILTAVARLPLDRNERRAWTSACTRWVLQIADGLAALHAAGTIHRDVKPSNVMVRGLSSGRLAEWIAAGADTTDHEAVLVDFGLSHRSASSNAGDPSIAGTRAYAPLEQLLGQAIGPSVDVFGLGVTLHDLLSRRPPRRRLPACSGLDDIHVLEPDLGADLAAVVTRACEVERAWRYADAAALRSDLRAWSEGREVAARPRRPLERAGRAVQAHPVRLVLALGGAVLLGTFAASAARGWRATERLESALRTADTARVGAALADLPWFWPDSWVSSAARSLRRLPADQRGPLDLANSSDEAALLGASLDTLQDVGWDSTGDVSVLADLLVRWVAVQVEGGPPQHRLGVRWNVAAPERGAGDVSAARQLSGLVADLANRCPAESIAAQLTAGPLRDAVRSKLASGPGSRGEQLALVTALGGVGTPDDVAPLLEWALDHPLGSEELRLGCWTVERLWRRALRDERSVDVEGETLELLVGRTADLARSFVEDPTLVDGRPRIALWAGSEALVRCAVTGSILAAASGRPIDWSGQLPAEALAWASTGIGAAGPGVRLLAASGDLRVAGWLTSPAVLVGDPWWGRPNLAGWVTGVLGDVYLTSRVRLRLADLGADDELASDLMAPFESGLAKGRAALGGVDVDRDVSRSARVDVTVLALEDVATVSEASDEPDRLASWDFDGLPVVLEGAARPPRGKGPRLLQASEGAVLELRPRDGTGLEMEVAAEPGHVPLHVVMHLQPAVDRQLPFQGQAYPTLTWNDIALDLGRSLQGAHRQVLDVPVPAELVDGGPVTLALDLDVRSTVSLWVNRVELVAEL